MVAEALLGEAADLQVALGEGGVFFHQPFREVAVNFVNQFHEIVPFGFLQVEVQGGGGDLLSKGESGHIHFVFLQLQLQLVLHFFGFQFGTQRFLSQKQQGDSQNDQQDSEDEVKIEAL